jgi:phage minor structural protein
MNAENYVVAYDKDGPVCIFQNAFHVIATNEVNAESTLEFDLYFTDKKRAYLNNQVLLRLENQIYKVKEVTDKKENGSIKTTHVYAENMYYDLARAARLESMVFDASKAKTPMTYALQNTEWSVGSIEINTARSFESTENNPLAVLQLIADVYDGELVFHSVERTVDLVSKTGQDRGMVFHYKKNMKSIERVISTASLVTRLYATGKDGMTFSSINGGVSYVENFTYTDEILIGSLDCSNFTSASDMLSYAKLRVSDYGKPSYSYKMSVINMQQLPGFRHEIYELGDVVRVVDEELGLDIQTRIVRMEQDILEPWNTVMELSTTIGTLSINTDATVQDTIDSVIKSFVAPRLVQATIDTVHGEVNAMYELGVPVKYSYKETADGIVFTHPDGVTCEIKII